MFRISYYLHDTGNYHVTLQTIGQAIILCPAFFRKQIGMKSNVVAGCRDVDLHTIVNLGFVVPSIWTRRSVV